MTYTKTTWVSGETALSADKNSLTIVETLVQFYFVSGLSSHTGNNYSFLTDQSVKKIIPNIPTGYKLIGHVNITINGWGGLTASFDHVNQSTSMEVDPYIFNAGNGNVPNPTTVPMQIRLYSLCIKDLN